MWGKHYGVLARNPDFICTLSCSLPSLSPAGAATWWRWAVHTTLRSLCAASVGRFWKRVASSRRRGPSSAHPATMCAMHPVVPSAWLFCPRDSPCKNTGVGCHALLQGIFQIQGLNLHLLRLLHWQVGFTTSATWEAQEIGYPIANHWRVSITKTGRIKSTEENKISTCVPSLTIASMSII